MTTAWITGASSGIGAACVAAAPPGTHTLSVARRPGSSGESLQLDLSLPEAWETLLKDVHTRFATGTVANACFVHLAGDVGPLGSAVDVNPVHYSSAFLLNAASTLVLGQGFLAACRKYGVPGTFVVASSPGATKVLPGQSQYCSSKAAVEKWVEVVAEELRGHATLRVLGVVPRAVDTPMVSDVMEADLPSSAYFNDLKDKGQLASPAQAAGHLWEAVRDPTCGPLVTIGARWLA